MKNSAKVLVALAAGAAIGGVLGILFAPDKGSATREKISDKAKDMSDTVGETLKDYVSMGKDKLEKVKDNLEAKLDKVNQKLKDVRNKNDYESQNSTI